MIEHLPKMNSKKATIQKWYGGMVLYGFIGRFQLLIYLSNFLDLHQDFPKICQSVVNRDIPLDDGYKILIASVAGLDSAY